MATKIEDIIATASGHADPETAAAIRREVADPDSETSRFLRAFSRAAANPLRFPDMPPLESIDCAEFDDYINELNKGFDIAADPIDSDDPVPEPPLVISTETGQIGGRPGLRQFMGWAAAACLLVALGYFIAYSLSAGSPQLLVASATPVFATGRGIAPWVDLEVHSNLSGYVTIVSLARGRTPSVLPPFGKDDVTIRPGIPTKLGPLPSDTTVVVFAITESPASDPIRDAIKGSAFSPDRADELEASLRSLLESRGYRRMAVGRRTVESPPAGQAR